MMGRTVIGRFAVTVLVLLVAFLLLTLKNKVLVGSQSLTAEISADGDRLEVEFVDVAGTSTLIGRDEDAVVDIKQAIYHRLSKLGSDGKPLTAVELDDITVQEERAVVEFDDGLPPLRDLQRWLETSGYELPNPDRALFHINLGIDLRGGVEFTTRLFKNGVRVGADATTVDILRKRLDSSGLVEPQVFRLTSGDVQVVIPGGTESDAARTRSVLETTGQLEVRELKYYMRDQDVSGDARTGYSFAPGYDNPKAPWEDVVYPLEEANGQYTFAHLGHIAWSGEGIASANVSADQNGEPAVSISLNAEAAPKNEAFTTRLREELVAAGGDGNIREPLDNGTAKANGVLAISLDGVIRSNPFVRGPSVSQTQISGSFTQDEAKKLVTVLRARAGPQGAAT